MPVNDKLIDSFLARPLLQSAAKAAEPATGLQFVADLVSDEDISSLNGVQTVDGESTGQNTRVLLTGQDDDEDNGLWIAKSSGDWKRVKGLRAGAQVSVRDGDSYAGTIWILTTADPIALGTDSQEWVRSGSGPKQFAIDSIADEYVVATDGTVIARPPTLQNPATNENGDTCTYSDEQSRTADDGTDTEDQIVYPAYVVGGIIYASLVDTTGVMYDPGGGADPVEARWIDLNLDARGWVQAP